MSARRRPARRWWAWEIAAGALALALPAVLPLQAPLVGEIAIVALFALSLDLVLGYAGIVSLGHAAFFGIGAYAAGLCAKHLTPDPLAGLALATALATGCGALASPSVLRGSDLTRLMVTLGTAALLLELANALAGVTGGADGLQGVAMGALPGGFTFDLDGRTAAWYALTVALLLFVALRRLVRSSFGVALRAIRDNRRRAEAVGIPTARHLAIAYTVAAGVAGAAGALLTQTTGFASLDVLSFERSADVLLMLVIGGAGWLHGGIAGAIVFKLLQDALASVAPQDGMFWTGLVLVLLALGLRDRLLRLRGCFRRAAPTPAGPSRSPEPPEPSEPGGTGSPTMTRSSHAPHAPPAPGMAVPADDIVLACHGLGVRLGGVMAASAVALELRRGARHALIGPNGAGKTTLMNLLGGELAPDAGRIVLGGADITRLPPHARVARGLVRSFQIGSLFDSLTARETLELAATRARGPGPGVGPGARKEARSDAGRPPAAADRAALLLDRLGLRDDADRPVRELAYGRRRLLEIALALACEPGVLLLDEPMAGVPAAERELLLDTLAALPPDVAVLLVEHDMDLVFRFAHRITVMAEGRVLAEGDPASIAADPRVRAVYLGPGGAGATGAGTAPPVAPPARARSASASATTSASVPVPVPALLPTPAPSARAGAAPLPPLLRVEALAAGHGDAIVLHAIDFTLEAGRTLALLGRNGAGKTTLVDTLAGAARQRGGRILWHDAARDAAPVALHALASHRRAALGLGWVPQERGIFASLTVQEHLTAVARPVSGRRGGAPAWTPARVYALFPRLAERRDHLGGQLSGGEQQMLAVGRALMLEPRLLLLDEPLEGLAPVLAAELLAAIARLTRDEGLAAIVVEQHPQAVLAIADQALVLDRGRVVHASTAAALAARPDLLARWLGVAGGG